MYQTKEITKHINCQLKNMTRELTNEQNGQAYSRRLDLCNLVEAIDPVGVVVFPSQGRARPREV